MPFYITKLRLIITRYLADFTKFRVFKEKAFWPTFWMETSATIDDELAFKIRLVTEDLANYVTLAAFAWVLIGLIVIICTLGYVIAYTRRSVRLIQRIYFDYNPIWKLNNVDSRLSRGSFVY